MVIKNHKELASVLTSYFNNNNFQNELSIFFHAHPQAKNRMKIILGNIITYFVVTRSNELASENLHAILHQSLQSNKLGTGYVIAKQIYNQLQHNKSNVTANDILNKVKENFITNGFYMHAFNKAHIQNIQKEGLKSNHEFFKKEKSFLLDFIPYNWDAESYRIYVTNHYNVLYNYGMLSPEWLSNCVGNNEFMINKNKLGAINSIVQRAQQHSAVDDKTLKIIEDYAKRAVDFYFNNKGFAIAIIDKNISNNNELMFLCNDPVTVCESDFDFNTYLRKENDEYFASCIGKNKCNEMELLGGAITYIINKYKNIEARTSNNISHNQLSIAQMPDFLELMKNKPLEK